MLIQTFWVYAGSRLSLFHPYIDLLIYALASYLNKVEMPFFSQCAIIRVCMLIGKLIFLQIAFQYTVDSNNFPGDTFVAKHAIVINEVVETFFTITS